MAKKLVPAPEPTKNKKRPAVSDELDEIFGARPSKKKASASASASAVSSAKPASAATPSTAAPEMITTKGKGKESDKAKHVGLSQPGKAAPTRTTSSKAAPRPVETVVDSSASLLKSQQPDAPPRAAGGGTDPNEVDEDEERFMDSRGTRRKTEDGLPIYSTKELKIGLGGDTELCPFDCDCCF